MLRRLTAYLSTVFLALFTYGAVLQPVFRLPPLPGRKHITTLLLLLFSLFHALYALGWRHTLVFFSITAGVSWAFEQVGVATGLVYGPYHYTDMLGIKLGYVPLLIPLAWFMMIYPSYALGTLIVLGTPLRSASSVGRIFWLAFVSAVIMTAWDVVMDPVMSGPTIRAWVWEQGGAYFGVPIRNFAGWLVTTFTVYVIYGLFEHFVQPRPAEPISTSMAALPLAAYALMMVSTIAGGALPANWVVGPFVMGFPLLIAAGRL